MPPPRRSLCNASSDVDLDLGRRMPSALSSDMHPRAWWPCSRAASIWSRTAISSASAIRASVAVRSTRSWTRQAGRGWPRALPPIGTSVSIAQGVLRIGQTGARHNSVPSLGAPPLAIRARDAKASCRRCNDCSISLASRLPSTALLVPCWGWRASSTRLSSGLRGRAWSGCAPG